MGLALVSMSKKTLKEQINQRMLDVANTASAQLEGDIVKPLNIQDKDTDYYKNALNTLRSFQENIDLDYIYTINPEGNDKFSFAIDPDRDDPADFGEAIETTDALLKAYKGTPSVDKKPHSDKWGDFYSAYSPIHDPDENIIGIVGVDFNANWYNDKLDSHRAIAIIITMVALTIGIVLSFIIFSQNRRRFTSVFNSISDLNQATEKFDHMIMQSSIKKLDMLPENESEVLKTLATGEGPQKHSTNEYDALSDGINSISNKFKKYIEYMDSQIYIDSSTLVNNKAAYRLKVKEIDESINKGTANFSIAFFDINGVKKIYTNFGFELGEEYLFECAKLLKFVFGKENVYHITGDEFIVIIDNATFTDMRNLFAKFDDELKQFNVLYKDKISLSVAKGKVTFDPETHKNYRQVLIEVEDACRRNKEAYYRNTNVLEHK